MGGVLGIVSEYNPFHNGHILHLKKSLELTKADFTIAIMSGNFVQRGEPSLVDKWSKTEMALRQGVDLVIELPTIYATSSAENFAAGAVKILNSLGIIDYLSFGSEIGQIKPLDDVATVLAKEPKEFSAILKAQLKSGLPYPKAREIALKMYFGNSPIYMDALQNPNNILGVEYLKALKRSNSTITPVTIKREYSEYKTAKVKNGITSATGIREMLQNGKNIHQVVPFETYEIIEKLQNKGNLITSLKQFEKEIIYALRKMPLMEVAKLPDVSEGLENKIKQAANSCTDLETLISKIKSKRFTESRIHRILLYALLGINKRDMQVSQKVNPYIRILGFNSHGKRIISAIAEHNPKAKIVVSVKRFFETNKDMNLQDMMMKDILATNIYTLKYQTNPIANLDYTHKILELK
ncbi:MAG: nucleotidyltransferase [Clostridia bacterium]|nr:nucleotidyltransferase [Clostridia bacterium]